MDIIKILTAVLVLSVLIGTVLVLIALYIDHSNSQKDETIHLRRK